MTKNVSPELTKNVKSDQKRQPCAAPALSKNRENKIKTIKIYIKNNKIIKKIKKMQRLARFWHADCCKKDKTKVKAKKAAGQIHYGFYNFPADAVKRFIFHLNFKLGVIP